MSIYVGIDLGTTQSVVSVITKNPITQQLHEATLEIPQENQDGDYEYTPLLPSIVYFPDGDEPYIGLKASQMTGDRRISLIKNHIGTGWNKNFNGTNWNPASISALYIKKLLSVVQDEYPSYQSNLGLTLSIPASFTPAMKEETIEACRIAGVDTNHLKVIHEPIAAVLTLVQTLERDAEANRFVRDGLLNGQDGQCRLLVFDLGGGTLDVALVTLQEKIEQDRYRISPTTEEISPHTLLGGYRFDEALAEYIIDKLKIDPIMRSNYLPKITQDMEQQKKIISNRRNDRGTEQVDSIYRPPQSIQNNTQLPNRIPISYADLRNAWSVLLGYGMKLDDVRDMSQEGAVVTTPKNILEPIASIFEKIGKNIKPEQVNVILPVGGMTSISLITERLQELFPHAKIVAPDGVQPSLAISRGAAYNQYLVMEHLTTLTNLLPHIQIKVNLNGIESWTDLIPKGTRLNQTDVFSRHFSKLAFPSNSNKMLIPVRLNGQERGCASISRPSQSQLESFQFNLKLSLKGESLIPLFEITSMYISNLEFSISELIQNPINEIDSKSISIDFNGILNDLKKHWSSKLNPTVRLPECDHIHQASDIIKKTIQTYKNNIYNKNISNLVIVKKTIRSSVIIDQPAHFLNAEEKTEISKILLDTFKMLTLQVDSACHIDIEQYLYIILGSFKQMLHPTMIEWMFKRLKSDGIHKTAKSELLMALGRSIHTINDWLKLSEFSGHHNDSHLEAVNIWALSRSVIYIKFNQMEDINKKSRVELFLKSLATKDVKSNNPYYQNLYCMYFLSYVYFKQKFPRFMSQASDVNSLRNLGKFPFIGLSQIEGGRKNIWNFIQELYSDQIKSSDIRNLLPIMMASDMEK